MRLVFVGPPGSGKGTQAKLLRERAGLTVIGTGDMLREAIRHGTHLGKQVESCLAAGRLVPDDLINEVVAELFRRDDHPVRFVIDGYPRTLAQAESFESMLRQHGLALEHVLHFVLPDDDVIRRLSGRLVQQQRTDDDEETVRRRLAQYHQSTQDMVEFYRHKGLLRVIDATQEVETVYRSIMALLGA